MNIPCTFLQLRSSIMRSYYDAETGLYYIQSRYYDPEICRFISADDVSLLTASPMALTDKNLYAYCDNNPVIRLDDNGELWAEVGFVALGGLINVLQTWGAIIGGLISGSYVGYVIYQKTDSWEKAILAFGTTAIFSTGSIANIANYKKKMLGNRITNLVDVVFNTGNNCISAATCAATVNSSEKTNNVVMKIYKPGNSFLVNRGGRNINLCRSV